jgi:hypothetical protein
MPPLSGAIPPSAAPSEIIKGKYRSNMSIRSLMNPTCSRNTMESPPSVLHESATQVWQRAIKTEAERRQQKVQEDLGASKLKMRVMSYGGLSLKIGRPKNAGRYGPPLASDASRADSRPASVELGPSSLDSAGMPHWAIQKWAAQIQGQYVLAKPRSTAIQSKKPKKKLTKQPESWAKWPSHTRDQRTGASGQEDNVKSKDFAVRSVTPNGIIKWSTDIDSGPAALKGSTRSFSGKLGQAVKSGLTKLKRTTSGLSDETSNSLRGRRRSSQAGGELDYPELEILPTEAGYRELMALEQEIEILKGTSQPGQTTGNDLGGGSQWSRRVSAIVHAMEHQLETGGDKHPTDVQEKDAKSRPETPASPQVPHGPDSTTATTTERFMTPPSRMTSVETARLTQSDDGNVLKTGVVVDLGRSRSLMEGVSTTHDNATWGGGRARTQAVLAKSIADFGIELDNMLTGERSRAVVASNQSLKM